MSSDLTKLIATPLRPNLPERPILGGKFNKIAEKHESIR